MAIKPVTRRKPAPFNGRQAATQPWPTRPADVVPVERVFSYLAALRRYWLIVVVATLLGSAGALGMSLTSAKKYEASAKLLLTNAEPIDVLSKTTGNRSLDPERDLNTNVQLVKLDSVASSVRAELHSPLTVPQLLAEVSAGPDGNSSVISVKATDPVARNAAAIANSFARHYVTLRRDQAQALYQEAAASAQARVATLTPAQQRLPVGRDLTDSANQLAVAATVQTGGVQVVSSATVPTTPSGPRRTFLLAVGLLLGLFVGAMCAFSLDRARQR
jgi:uncharacterized protein involved in exopolysaccharide biosynthesis